MTGNDQRCSCLIDQNRVHLINNGKFHATLYELFFIDHHIISQIIKAQFVVRHISNITVISCTSFIIVHGIQHHADSKSQEFMYFSHPLGITLRQIIVDRDNMNPFSGQRIQVCRKCRHEGLTFTGSHLGNSSLMQDNTTNQLHPVMTHSQCSHRCFTYNGKCLRQDIIQRLPFSQSLPEFAGLRLQLCIGQLLHLRFQCFDMIYNRINML